WWGNAPPRISFDRSVASVTTRTSARFAITSASATGRAGLDSLTLACTTRTPIRGAPVRTGAQGPRTATEPMAAHDTPATASRGLRRTAAHAPNTPATTATQTGSAVAMASSPRPTFRTENQTHGAATR